jgi:hypothetical protein
LSAGKKKKKTKKNKSLIAWFQELSTLG